MATYQTTSNNTNYARLCRMVVDLGRDMLWRLLVREIPAHKLPTEIRKSLSKKKPTLRLFAPEQQKLCPPGNAVPTRQDCDTSVLYRLLRGICPRLPTPAKGWNKQPGPRDVGVADDIERIHFLRNELSHLTNAEISDVDFQLHWQTMKGLYTSFFTYVNMLYLIKGGMQVFFAYT
jgi:hypothetical protein